MLSEQQHTEFLSRGYLLPGAEASVAQQLPEPESLAALLAANGPAGDPAVHRHLDDPMTYALCTLPSIIERVATILGPDILLWHSRYFDKPAGGSAIPWHQDAPFWNIEPKLCVSVWLALDKAHRDNGCVYVLPGSHMSHLPHLASEGTDRFGIRADPSTFDDSSAVAVELSRGEFFLFDRWVLHRSSSNPGRDSRLALSMRFITPEVRVAVEKLKPVVPGYGVQVVRGQDRLNLNPVAPAPVD